MKTRVVLFVCALAFGATLPASAQIPAGPDRWVTPANGQTFVVVPDTEIAALCGAEGDPALDHKIPMVGVPAIDATDWDTEVRRLDKATFVNRVASTRIVVTQLNFKGIDVHETACGRNTFSAHLSGAQPVTNMTLRQTHANGGVFFADIEVSTKVVVYDVSGAILGGIPFVAKLPSPATGTPYTWNGGVFKPGIDSSAGPESCVPALRAKQATYPVDSSHYYFIENLIAQGKCTKRG
jgi:hypothetical protein